MSETRGHERVRQTLLMVIPSPYAEPEYCGIDDDPGDCHASFRMVELRAGEAIVSSDALADSQRERAQLAEQLSTAQEEARRHSAARIRANNLLSTFRDHAFDPDLLENDVEEIDAYLTSALARGEAGGNG